MKPSPKNTPSPARPEDLPALTSLRFVAAMMIVMLHATNYFPWASVAAGYPLNLGVSFFFVLSGFILTHVYSGKNVPYGTFMRARVARLWPIHFVTCMLVIGCIRADSQQLPGSGFFSPWLALASNLTLTHALVPFQIYTFSWNSVSWSISTEMFFYLAFPLLVKNIAATWHWKLAACALIILTYAWIASALHLPFQADPTQIDITFLTYASPLFRAFEFVLGMAAYTLWSRFGRLRLGRVAATVLEVLILLSVVVWVSGAWTVLAPAFRWSTVVSYWYQIAGSSVVFAVLIVVFASGRGIVGQLLSCRPLVWLGKISFALYMVHQVLMKWVYLQQLEGRMGPTSAPVIIGACLAAAALLHYLVEVPARQFLMGKRRTSRGAQADTGAITSPST